MAIFDGHFPQVQNTVVSSSATLIFDAAGTSTRSGVAYTWDFTADSDVTVINTGPVAVHVGIASVTATAVTVPAGKQLTLQAPIVDLYAITGSATATVIVGLASNASVV